jgi:ATPase family protein associated with various cellular activities (AAA)
MTEHERLAYEIRRLSDRLLARVDDRNVEPATQGELARRLASAFELQPIEVDLSLTVLGYELDAEFRSLVHSALPPGDRASELGLLAALIPDLEARLAALDAVGPHSPLVLRHIVRRVEEGDVAYLRATRRFRATALGRPVLADLPGFAHVMTDPPPALPWIASPPALSSAMAAVARGALCVASGATGTGKTSWACSTAAEIGLPILYIDVAAAADRGRVVAIEIRELIEDAALAEQPVVLDNAGGYVSTDAKLTPQLLDVLERVRCRIFLVVDDATQVAERLRTRALSHVTVENPPQEVRRHLWEATAAVTGSDLRTIAEDLVLGPRQIQNAADLIQHGGLSPAAAAIEQLPKEHKLTVPNRATARLSALILPKETREEIAEVIHAIRSRVEVLADVPGARGRGISALFDGDSGTGKTFTCEVIAAEVGLPLMRVNVASLVDKYIGETEKNLTRVFQQAQAHGGILFFDEADAMFGTRTDVSRSQDRYANLETNLLLQLMEEFSGVVLLTTNLKRNIDPAFMRRIMYKVYFEVPEARERAMLWQELVPASRRGERLDFLKLGQNFELTGGSIRSAALRAAYRCSAAGRGVTMNDLVECAKLESASMGRVAAWK